MVRTGLGVAVVVGFASLVLAADTAEKKKAPPSNVMAVREVLARLSKMPLAGVSAGDVLVLRGVADLLEKESATYPAATGGSANGSASQAAPADQRKRLVIRLQNASVGDAVKALEEFLASQPQRQQASQEIGDRDRVFFVAQPAGNVLLLSAPPRVADLLLKQVAELDKRPDFVMVSVCIAELRTPPRDAKNGGTSSDDAAMEKAPSMESDGAAWLEWANKHGRLEVLSRPKVVTLDRQAAVIKIGSMVPIAPKASAECPAESQPIEHAEVGLTVSLMPRIASDGVVVLDVDFQHADLVQQDSTAGPTIRKRGVQFTVAAKDGQTTVLSQPTENAADGCRQMIIAVKPEINPKQR